MCWVLGLKRKVLCVGSVAVECSGRGRGRSGDMREARSYARRRDTGCRSLLQADVTCPAGVDGNNECGTGDPDCLTERTSIQFWSA